MPSPPPFFKQQPGRSECFQSSHFELCDLVGLVLGLQHVCGSHSFTACMDFELPCHISLMLTSTVTTPLLPCDYRSCCCMSLSVHTSTPTPCYQVGNHNINHKACSHDRGWLMFCRWILPRHNVVLDCCRGGSWCACMMCIDRVRQGNTVCVCCCLNLSPPRVRLPGGQRWARGKPVHV